MEIQAAGRCNVAEKSRREEKIDGFFQHCKRSNRIKGISLEGTDAGWLITVANLFFKRLFCGHTLTGFF